MKQWIIISILSLTATAIHIEDQFTVLKRGMDSSDIHSLLAQRSNSLSTHNLDSHRQPITRRWIDNNDHQNLHRRVNPFKSKSRSVSPKPKKIPNTMSSGKSQELDSFRFSPPKVAEPISAHAERSENSGKRLVRPKWKSSDLNDALPPGFGNGAVGPGDVAVVQPARSPTPPPPSSAPVANR